MTLKPCPFCGSSATIEQVGTPRMSCIVACDSCGARLECSDVGERSGSSWNRRDDTVVRNLLEEGHEIISEYACGHTVWLAAARTFLEGKPDIPVEGEWKDVLCVADEAEKEGCVGASEFARKLYASVTRVSVPDDVVLLYAVTEEGDFFITFTQPRHRMTFTLSKARTDSSWHVVSVQASQNALEFGPLDSGTDLFAILQMRFPARVQVSVGRV